MKIINGTVLKENGKLEEGEVQFSDGIITECTGEEQEVFDAQGYYILPGMIDIHIHGAMGVDVSDGNRGDLEKMSDYLISKGITSFLPTSMSYDEKILLPIFEKIGNYIKTQKAVETAEVLGINMEGPYINPEKAGAQKKENIKKPSIDKFNELWEASAKNIKLVDIAPEVEGAEDFIYEISKRSNVSLAHSNATYDEACRAFEKGAKHVTHLFNAMSAFNHRDPGLVGAAIEYAKHVELICDGIHVHPEMVCNTFKLFGKDRVCLISDSMRAAGMVEGEYTLGGQKVIVKNNKAVLENGSLAGSITNLHACLKNAIKFGVPIEEAMLSVTRNPAKAIGIFEEKGSLSIGKVADITILDKDFELVTVFKNGIQVTK